MRKIAAGLFISLDGVVEGPDKWIGPYFNDQVGGVVGTLMAANDAMLLGRATYEEFATQVRELKQQPDGGIGMSGSSALIRWLLRYGLLDLLLFPVVIGSGQRLFGETDGQQALTLTGSESFSTGVVHLSYELPG
jgi:dihydrofolate reductase